MNVLVIAGRLCNDAELKYTPAGKAMAKFSVAVDNGFGDKKTVDFFNCILWDKRGESLAKYLQKGAQVCVKGRFNSRKYDDKLYWTLTVEDIKLMGSRAEKQQNKQAEQRKPSNDDVEIDEFDVDEMPF